MDEPRLIDRCRSKASRILIGMRIQQRRVFRRPATVLSENLRRVLRTAVRFSLIGRLAGWIRRHPRWAALELAGLLLAAVIGLPSASRQTDAVDVDETTARFDDIVIQENGGDGFAEQELHSPPQPDATSAGASQLEGPSLSGGPLLVPVPPDDPSTEERTTRFHPATVSSPTAASASRFVRSSRRTDGKTGAWLTGTIESVEPTAKTAGRIQFNPVRRQ